MKLTRTVLLLGVIPVMGCGNGETSGVDAGVITNAVTLNRANLTSDVSGTAANFDPKLINGWGLAFGPSAAWVAANGSGVLEVYNNAGALNATLPTVNVPTPANQTGASTPTGLVFNSSTASFNGDTFIVVTENGTIKGWQAANGDTAQLRIDNSASADHAVYKGVAIGSPSGGSRLYAADFHNARIDVYDAAYAPVTLQGAFADPNLPAGFAPFNIYIAGAKVYVSYAKQDSDQVDDVAGVGNGFIDTYDLNGGSQARLVSGGALNSPWGMAIAPANFGAASNQLLVGNFGDGRVNAYNASNGAVTTQVRSNEGTLAIDGLWALVFGNGTSGAATNQLFFTSGPTSETHGVFGRLDVQ